MNSMNSTQIQNSNIYPYKEYLTYRPFYWGFDADARYHFNIKRLKFFLGAHLSIDPGQKITGTYTYFKGMPTETKGKLSLNKNYWSAYVGMSF
jgi:hypothetical protein